MSQPTPSQGPWPGRFVWHDLMTKDAKKAQEFYCSLFDWQIQEVPIMGSVYRMILCGPGPIGGIMEEQNIPMAHWMPYCAVDDLDAAAKKVAELGGTVCVPPTDIPDTGRFSVINDPQGAWLSIYKGNPESQGADPDMPVPGRVCWNEVYTTDTDGAQKFYSGLFGWQPDAKDMGENGMYFIQMHGDRQAGGMMKHPMPGVPPCWVIYFLVEDLNKSTEKAKELGANVMMANIPIPEVGKFSMMTDPTGAMFSLFEASEELKQQG